MASSYSFYGDRYSDGALQFSQPIPHPCKTKTRNTIALSSFSDGRFRSKVNSIKEDEEKKVQLQKDPPTATSKGDVNACGDCCCCRVFYSDRFREFSSDTTLHGLRYAVAEGVEPWRRFLWTVLLVIAVSATAVYMYLCWYKFFSFPVNTVVTLTYKSKLRFPAITICNYNQYRKSVVKGTRFEEWVRQQYPLFNFSDDDVQVELDESILEANRTWFDQMAAHSKWSMIYQCTFGSVKIPCSASNFTETFTDFGVCYTFNGADREGGALLVGHSGSEHGLRMRLFVNQSEYTFGEHCGAGFKILPHPQDEVPLVRNFGFAVSPGTEALVGLKMIQEHNLPAPYASQCSNETLQYFAKYARSNCVRERQTDAVVAKCGCREPYMPSDARVCNYNETRVCVRPELVCCDF
uniref:Acid-sensing ion channel 1-like n=1 Tax=Saccoglossus kowalevskii TaxID=10224 RepID=A0ABM0N1G2_SACKO|nr:PREDICTED: acid-sensing ion channel 1-like [Saccoglossus kowalevskii]